MKGRTLASRYRIESPLGTGGMSTVWAATDLRLDAPVAIKLLDPSIADNEKSLARFLREAKTSAKLRSRHVVASLDCGVDANVPFIVMELLDGITLRARLKERGRLAPMEAAQILLDMARGIQAAHAVGVIHRDLKPENVFLVKEGDTEYARILDFGIAKQTASPEHTASLGLTEPGSLFGTPNYMSPEQIDARSPIDHRTDIWSMAIVAFECLTGRVPFGEATLRDQLMAICARPLPVPSEVADVPNGFDAWFARAAAQDAALRFASVKEAVTELCRVCGLTPQSLSPPPQAPVGAQAPNASVQVRATNHALDVNPLPFSRWGWLALVSILVALLALVWWRNHAQESKSAVTPLESSTAIAISEVTMKTSAIVPGTDMVPTVAVAPQVSAATVPSVAPEPQVSAATVLNVAPSVASTSTTQGFAGAPMRALVRPTPREPGLISRAVRK